MPIVTTTYSSKYISAIIFDTMSVSGIPSGIINNVNIINRSISGQYESKSNESVVISKTYELIAPIIVE